MLKLLIIMSFVVLGVICCPKNCLECSQDQRTCLICQKNFELNARLNSCNAINFTYNYLNQSRWGGVCGYGNRQTPINIDIRSAELCPQDKIVTNNLMNSNIFINPIDSSLTATFANLSKINFFESGLLRQFSSAQFHWHYPSEHRVNGRIFDLQLHIVHTEQDNPQQYSVIGLFFNVNDRLRTDIIDNIEFGNTGQIRSFRFPWDIRNKMFFHYKGSLTTPPCAQSVDWFLITQVYPISRRNFQKIRTQINGGLPNSRNIQPLNGRRVQIFGNACRTLRGNK